MHGHAGTGGQRCGPCIGLANHRAHTVVEGQPKAIRQASHASAGRVARRIQQGVRGRNAEPVVRGKGRCRQCNAASPWALSGGLHLLYALRTGFFGRHASRHRCRRRIALACGQQQLQQQWRRENTGHMAPQAELRPHGWTRELRSTRTSSDGWRSMAKLPCSNPWATLLLEVDVGAGQAPVRM